MGNILYLLPKATSADQCGGIEWVGREQEVSLGPVDMPDPTQHTDQNWVDPIELLQPELREDFSLPLLETAPKPLLETAQALKVDRGDTFDNHS